MAELPTTRARLLDAGWTASSIRHAVRAGRLRRIGWDLYVAGAVAPDELLAAAVDRWGPGVALSHTTAAARLGYPVLSPDGRVHLTVATHRRVAVPSWVRLHRTVHVPDAIEVDGLPVTEPVRTLLDCLRTLPTRDAVVVLDAAGRDAPATVSATSLAVQDLRPDAHGRRRALLALALTDPRAESPLETLARLTLRAAGLPPAELQFVVLGTHGEFLARVDLAWPAARLAVELDGRAYHEDPAAFQRDRERQNALVNAGWRVLRFTWADLLLRPETVVQQVRAAL